MFDPVMFAQVYKSAHAMKNWVIEECIIKLCSPHVAGLPARLNPDWCRFLTGCLVGEVRAEAEGVPPRDRENSDTGPSYIPLGTAFSTASYGKKSKPMPVLYNTACGCI